MDKPIIKRMHLDILSVLVLCCYAELKHLHYFTPNEFPYNTFGTLFIMLLVIPFLSIFVRVEDYLNAKARRRPVSMRIDMNKIIVWFEEEKSVVVDGKFSREQDLIADQKELTETMSKAFLRLSETDEMKLAPYLLIIGGDSYSDVIAKVAQESALSAGACHVVIAPNNVDAKLFAEQNKQPTFA